jgi:NAD(P)-dependent dehydrogenase (short-subunit alcohol dehydrogenase family)
LTAIDLLLKKSGANMRLKDKVAIVTGAANGMGEADARLFAREGAAVILTDLDEARGRSVADEINNQGGRANFIKADASSESDWRAVLTHTHKLYGQLDILVNNAGISSSAVEPTCIDAWDKLMTINAKSAYLGTQMASEVMVKVGRGSIINISSTYGIVGGPTGHPAYYASKAAVRNLTKAMAVRLAPHGVRVNSVHPGFMTPMLSAKSRRPGRETLSPMGRSGRPIEVAYGVLFLTSDEASYVTGTELVIDGGFLCSS